MEGQVSSLAMILSFRSAALVFNAPVVLGDANLRVWGWWYRPPDLTSWLPLPKHLCWTSSISSCDSSCFLRMLEHWATSCLDIISLSLTHMLTLNLTVCSPYKWKNTKSQLHIKLMTMKRANLEPSTASVSKSGVYVDVSLKYGSLNGSNTWKQPVLNTN